jgi:uncharacterized membrane protein
MVLSMRPRIVIACLLLGACGDSVVEETPMKQDVCETTTASYATVADPFMRTWCTPCHHTELEGPDRPLGSEGVNLDTYELVISHLDRIEARALADTPTMPPGGGPSDEELTRLELWLECGSVDTLSLSASPTE